MHRLSLSVVSVLYFAATHSVKLKLSLWTINAAGIVQPRAWDDAPHVKGGVPGRSAAQEQLLLERRLRVQGSGQVSSHRTHTWLEPSPVSLYLSNQALPQWFCQCIFLKWFSDSELFNVTNKDEVSRLSAIELQISVVSLSPFLQVWIVFLANDRTMRALDLQAPPQWQVGGQDRLC
jgi:hypothetical protein